MKTSLIATLAVLALAGTAFADTFQTVDTGKGEVLAADNGMTLYTFRKDEKGVSNCYDTCAEKWPPYIADGMAKPFDDYTLVTRKDGSQQWAQDGMPLYFWINDAKAGDTTGDGVGGIWDVAHP